MFYEWVRQGAYVAAVAVNYELVALGAAMVPDDDVLLVAFAGVGYWGGSDEVAGSAWVIHPRERIAALTVIAVGGQPSDGGALLMPNLWGVHDGYLAQTDTGQMLVGVKGATSFTQIPEVEVWHYRPMTTTEIVEALPMAEVTAALESTNLYSAIGGAYSDAINRGVQPAPTAGRPAYVVINAPSA